MYRIMAITGIDGLWLVVDIVVAKLEKRFFEIVIRVCEAKMR